MARMPAKTTASQSRPGAAVASRAGIGSERESEEEQHDGGEEERAHRRVATAQLGTCVLSGDGEGDARLAAERAHRAAPTTEGRGAASGGGGVLLTPSPLASTINPRSSVTRPSRSASRRSVL